MDDSMTRDSGSERAIVVSNDTHIGPRLVEDLREYCPSSYLDEFDRFAADRDRRRRRPPRRCSQGSGYLDHPNLRTLGHHDSAARLADYDHDGIAAGVIFHGQHEHGTDPVRRRRHSASPKTTATASSSASA